METSIIIKSADLKQSDLVKGDKEVCHQSQIYKSRIIEAIKYCQDEDGYGALTSKALGTYLGSSARPILLYLKMWRGSAGMYVKSTKALYKEYVNKRTNNKSPRLKGWVHNIFSSLLMSLSFFSAPLYDGAKQILTYLVYFHADR